MTRLRARKASEMAILTCRALQFSRVQSSATVVTRSDDVIQPPAASRDCTDQARPVARTVPDPRQRRQEATMAEPDGNGISARLWRLPGQLLLALIKRRRSW